ncbi:MAG: NAD(P)/FAD-dependent oxidoreductase [Oscillospiraceae bacterium]|nr:NAD(P)/FAD-dependent oxidoreductase [Oscillospiraceae bacterium]
MKVVIIGGGAAGLMAAVAAANCGNSVIVVEKNERPALKLRITGKGRCNITNNCPPAEVIANATRNGRFLYSAVNAFSPADTIAFFEKLGVPTKTERGRRVFPQSDKAADVANALINKAKSSGVKFVTAQAEKLLLQNNTAVGVKLKNSEIFADKIIIATGGASYPKTGSTGDGYKFAKQTGHTVTPIRPSLVPLKSNDDFILQLQGLALKNAAIKVTGSSGKVFYTDFGELLFTHFGVSGPVILSASAHIPPQAVNSSVLHIDLKPALTVQQLDTRLLRDLTELCNKNAANILHGLLPKSLCPIVAKMWGVGDVKCNSVTKEQRRKLCEILKDFKVNLTDFCPIEEAIVTSGGVEVSEINPKTMESKLCKNLFFAGEVIDCDAYTGGYNLQIAWSTGWLSGSGTD